MHLLFAAALGLALPLRPGAAVSRRCCDTRSLRSRGLALCDAGAPPTDDIGDIDTIAEHCRAAVRSAVIDDGLRCVRVEARLPSLDPTDAAHFDKRAFVHVALQCVRGACVDLSEGRDHVVLLPCLRTLAAAEEALADEWPDADRARLRLGLLEHFGEPADDEPRLASVLVAGFEGAASLDDQANRHACAWLRHCKTAICLNSQVRLLRGRAHHLRTFAALCVWRR